MSPKSKSKSKPNKPPGKSPADPESGTTPTKPGTRRHKSPSSANGRIVRVALSNGYRAYSADLLCRLTRWHELHGGACPHGDSLHAASSHYPYDWDDSRSLTRAIENPSRRVEMEPGEYRWKWFSVWGSCPEGVDWAWPRPKQSLQSVTIGGGGDGAGECEDGSGGEGEGEDEEAKVRVRVDKKRKGGKARSGGNGGDLRMRFAGTAPGRDDPVEDGRKLAFAGDFLPSDRTRPGRQIAQGGGGGVGLVTSEEKELADLRKQGILSNHGAAGEDTISLKDIARNEPSYTIRLARKKKRAGRKEKGKEAESGAAVATTPIASDATLAGDDNILPVEALKVIPDCCWAGFFADMEAEGWVPVVDDDLASVAESWVVMEEESENGETEQLNG